jgi:hypothetical protein
LEMLKLCSEWGSEMPERGSKTSKVSGLWANFGIFFFF